MITGLLKKYKEVIMYLIFGVLTTLINIAIYWIFTDILYVDYMVSNVIAWCLSVLFAYVTNRIYVFNSKSKKREIMKELFLFISVRLSSFLVDIAIMFVGVTIMSINDMTVKIFVNILIIIINYVMSKFIVFKKSKLV